MNHAMRLVKRGSTWDYSCSCNKFKKSGLKFEASAKTMHDAHLKDLNSTKKVAKSKKL